MEHNLLITGGGRGIGAAVATLAATRGQRVAINYQENASAANAVVQRIRDMGGVAVAIRADVSNPNDVQRLFEEATATLGPISGLVNSAGITGKRGKLEGANAEEMRRVLEVNTLGVLLCCQAAVQRMSTQRGGMGGAIVNVSSAAATLGSPNDYVWYAASKAGVDAVTVGLAREVAFEGVRVNAVAGGFIATDMSPPERLAQVVPTVPMQRAGTSEEIAQAVLFLLSEESAYTTGAVLRVAGGR